MTQREAGLWQMVRRRIGSALSPRFWRSLLRGILGYVRREGWHLSVHRMRFLYRLRIEAVLRSPVLLLEWSGSKVRVWVDGGEFFQRVQTLIHRAHRSIAVQMFIWKDDPLGRSLAQSLVEAADRGVKVDITKDAMGDTFELTQDFLSTRTLTSEPWQRLWSHPDILIRHIPGGEHAKVFIVDGERLLLGGMNVGEEYLSWHDYFVELKGSSWVEAFLEGRSTASPRGSIRLVLNAPDGRRDIRPCLTDLIITARRSIVVEHAYCSDPAIIELLARKSREGVRVVVILPAQPDVHGSVNLLALDRLLALGDPRSMRVFLFPGMFHAKLLLVDGRRLFLGSANLIASSLDMLGEANVLIHHGHRRLLRRIRRGLRHDMQNSRCLTVRPRLQWWSSLLARVGL